MWLLFGLLAIVFAIINVVFTFKGKKISLFGFISMAFTSCTACAFYSHTAKWVIEENWSAIMDTTPYDHKMLWVCVIASIVINGICLLVQEIVQLFKNKKEK